MLGRWMRMFGAPRPWMVAAALATASFAGCGRGGSAPAKDAGAAAPCEPNTVYGPPICRTDEDCREANGEGWVCGSEPLRFDDGCGRQIEWGRVCEPGPGSGAAPGGSPAPASPSAGARPAARTDLPPPLPARDVGPAEE